MTVQTKITGRLQKVVKFENEGKLPTFVLTMRVQNKYKNKDGEHAGKYGSKFYDVKYFPQTENQVGLIENTIQKRAGQQDKIMTVDADLVPTVFRKNGEAEDRHELQLIAQDFKLEN